MISRTIINDIITSPAANEFLFFLIANIKIIRLIVAPRLINPPSLPCLCRNFQLSSTGKSEKIKVKKITEEVVAKHPVKKPIKTSFLSKIPCV